MYGTEPQTPIMLQFRSMYAPVTVTVPSYVLRYLDLHAERDYTRDGQVIYRQTERSEALPDVHTPRYRPTLLAV